MHIFIFCVSAKSGNPLRKRNLNDTCVCQFLPSIRVHKTNVRVEKQCNVVIHS